MKLLVLWNTAGAFSPIAEWMIERGHEVRIVARRQFDPFGHTDGKLYGIMVDSARGYYVEGVRQIRSFKPDVIQVSSSLKMLLLSRIFAPRTPIVMTYHGHDVRGRERVHPESRLADRVTVTTQDLSKYGEWLDRVIPPMFYYRGGRNADTALGVYADFWFVDTRPMMDQWCEDNGATLTLLDRSASDFEPIPHDDMPEFLSTFEYYLDFKGHGKEQYALSRGALEAMACGCRVFHDSDLEHDIKGYKMVRAEDYFDMYSSLERASLWRTLKRLPRVLLGLAKWTFGRLL